MRQTLVNSTELTQPALVVTFGNTTKKRRILNKAITTIGHSPGCDVMINSPDVAPVHCVLVQLEDGLWVRNCATKLSTRVNGDITQEIRLKDSDILQVGAFVFEIKLPPKQNQDPSQAPPTASLIRSKASGETQRNDASETARVPEAVSVPSKSPSRAVDLVDLAHLKRSRRNLCRLALLFRDRLRKADAEKEQYLVDNKDRLEELEDQEEELRQQAEELDQRQEALERDEQYLDARAQQLEKELAQKRKQAEKEMEQEWAEHRARLENAPVPEPESAPVSTSSVASEEATLNIRQGELDAYAKHLQEQKLELEKRATELGEEYEAELERLREENDSLRNVDEDVTDGLTKALEALRNENQTLRKRLDSAPKATMAASAPVAAQKEHELQKLRLELMRTEDHLRETEDELRALKEKPVPTHNPGEETIRSLRDHIEKLEVKLQESEAEVEKLSVEMDAWNMEVNLEHSGGYERELHRFRVELEHDRRELEEQMRQLEGRSAEIDEVARCTELELSRERALLSRERSELNRMREAIKLDQARSQRDGRTTERLANIRPGSSHR